MRDDRTTKVRGYHRQFRNQLQLLGEDHTSLVVRAPTVAIIWDALKRLAADFPGLVPWVDPTDFRSSSGHFLKEPISAHLGIVVGILEAELDAEIAPVTEPRPFPFVRDVGIRAIVERDYVELQRAYVAQCWKSVIILAGSTIEAVLLDALLANADAANRAPSAPKEANLLRWDFAALIEVSVETGLASAGVSKLSHPIREYRNLVHPGNEVRTKGTFGPEEARIAMEVLHILHRDLGGG